MKAFIREHQPHYPDVDIKYIPGADPEMVFLNAEDSEVMRVDVAVKSTEEIIELLAKYGLHEKIEPPQEEEEEEAEPFKHPDEL